MKLLSLFAAILISSFVIAQNGTSKLPPVDKSPMDMAYYPSNYPVLKIQNKVTETPVARVIYSRPQKAGRVIFGELVEFGEIWRLGANEATELEFYKDVKIAGKKVPKGRYTLYAIPNQSNWTVIINKDTDTWGAFKYDAKKDILRTQITVQKSDEVAETLAMEFISDQPAKVSKNFSLVISWDDTRLVIPVSY